MIARLPVLSIALAAAACAPHIEPAGPALRAPALEDGRMVVRDAVALPVRRWLPQGMPRAAVVALHGFNDYSNAFDQPARFLAGRGIATYAFDQRGFGGAPNRGLWAGARTMVEDTLEMAAAVRRAHPGVPLYLLGVSMGGSVALLAAADGRAPAVDGVVLVAPAVWGRRHMGVIQRSALWLFAHTLPWVTLTGQGLHITPSDNTAMLRALGRDPMVIKATRIDTIHGLVDLMDEAYAAAPRIARRTLILYGHRDEIVPKAATFDMLKRLRRNPAVRSAVYANGYHMLLRDLGADGVLADIVAWIADPGAPLPSGADAEAARVLAAN